MHELGITQEILRTAIRSAEEAGGTSIKDVAISVGELTEVVDFALQFNWDIITKDTIAEGATLSVRNVPPRSKCRMCGHEYDHDKFDFTCPECDNMLVDTLTGRELQIDSIDIETPDDAGDGEQAAGEASSPKAASPEADG